MDHYDVIVLGTGGVGSAALFHLAKRGVRTLGIDRFDPPHDRGSSHGETRIIRQAYFEHPDYVPLLLEAYQRWAELESLTGTQLFHQVGLLQVGPPEGEVVAGVLRSAEQHQLPVERLTAEAIERRWPAFRVPAGDAGVFEPRAGYLLVEKCVQAHLSAAAQAGARRMVAAVQAWSVAGGQVIVQTDRGHYGADRLILTAGPWAGALLAEAAGPLQVRRKHAYWFPETTAWQHERQGCPTFLFQRPHGVFYGFPVRDALGLKAAEHTGGEEVTDPLQDARDLDSTDLARVRSFLRDCLPGVGEAAPRHAVCYYTMTPDEHFVVDRHPVHPQIHFAAGLSGHGFKFTALLGEVLADLSLNGRTRQPVDFLRRRPDARR